MASIVKQFASGKLDGSQNLDTRTRKKAAESLGNALKDVLKEPPMKGHMKSVGSLSISDRSQLLAWMNSATGEASEEAARVAAELETSSRRLLKIEAALAQAPTEDTLKPTVAELNDLHRKLGAAEQELAAIDDDLDRLGRESADVDRRLEKLRGSLQETQKREDRVAVVRRSQAALKEYLISVTALKLEQLEREVTHCFATLSRKSDHVHQIRINPETFEISLIDKAGQPVPKERLSAGEKQVFAIALLWALGRTSGRPLPVIIDTPLARLDTDHRKLLIERYLPSASHQVLVLSTDTEVDEQLFEALKPSISHAYHLGYDQSERYTTATAGYFWTKDAESENTASPILHRG
jgi:DNA sulfur modification protein DndD